MSNYLPPRNGEVAPVTIQGYSRDETVTTHPAFAMIGASRVSGHANLHDSDFHHNNFMRITIKRGELHRNLNRDWHGGREEYITVAMSEAQWATFVSAPNIGDGVPCTLLRRNGEGIPGIPALDRSEQIKSEIGKDLADAIRGMDEALAAVDDLGLSAKKAAAVREKIVRAKKLLDDSIPFAAKQFAEHVETTVEKGKQEIHGYMLNAIQRAGIESLKGAAPLALEEKNDE